MPNVTYGRLDEVLRTLGFTLRGVEEENKIYRHEATEAWVILPEFPADLEVIPRHLLMVRSVLEAYGIADPLDLSAELQRVS